MTRTPLACASLLSCIAFSGAVFALTPLERNGALSVTGSRIVGGDGEVAQLRGMSLCWSQANAGKSFYNAGVVGTLAVDWKADLVRAPMGVEDDLGPLERGYLSDPSGNKDRVKVVVDAAIAKGLYVIIDWHDQNALSHQSQAVAFFDEMSKTYGTQPNVIFEIFDEPTDVPWQNIKTYATAVLAAIRKNSDNLVIVGNSKWDSDLITVANDPLKGAKNVAYSFHMYTSEPTHHANYMGIADQAIKMGLPIFVSEWGLTLANGNGPINTSWVEQFWNWMEVNKLSSCAWSISDTNLPSAALKAGTSYGDGTFVHSVSVDGGWIESDLTNGGTWLRSKLRGIPPVKVVPVVARRRIACVRTASGQVAFHLDPSENAKSLTVLDARGVLQATRPICAGIVEGLDLKSGVHLVRLDNGRTTTVVVP